MIFFKFIFFIKINIEYLQKAAYFQLKIRI